MEASRRTSIASARPFSLRRLALRVALLAALLPMALGARSRTGNFIVETPDPAFAQQAAQTAEQCRRDWAIAWLGKAMPNWSQPCVITIDVGEQLSPGGATTFVFDRGEVFGWRMSIQGSRQRVLDSVLPHEITHMVFASHFRQPLPRWADEGGATSVEHASERTKQRTMLNEFLRTGRGIAFGRMFAMTEYPHDIMPLYSQGYSLAEFLIQTAGRRKYVEFLGDGLDSDDWAGAVERHYAIHGLGTLQNTWLAWVRQGWPAIKPQEAQAPTTELASNEDRRPRPEPNLIYRIRQQEPAEPLAALVPVHMRPAHEQPESAVAGITRPLTAVSPDRWVDPTRPLSPPAERIAVTAPPTEPATIPTAGWHTPGVSVAASSGAPSVDPFSTQVARPQPMEKPR